VESPEEKDTGQRRPSARRPGGDRIGIHFDAELPSNWALSLSTPMTPLSALYRVYPSISEKPLIAS